MTKDVIRLGYRDEDGILWLSERSVPDISRELDEIELELSEPLVVV